MEGGQSGAQRFGAFSAQFLAVFGSFWQHFRRVFVQVSSSRFGLTGAGFCRSDGLRPLCGKNTTRNPHHFIREISLDRLLVVFGTTTLFPGIFLDRSLGYRRWACVRSCRTSRPAPSRKQAHMQSLSQLDPQRNLSDRSRVANRRASWMMKEVGAQAAPTTTRVAPPFRRRVRASSHCSVTLSATCSSHLDDIVAAFS